MFQINSLLKKTNEWQQYAKDISKDFIVKDQHGQDKEMQEKIDDINEDQYIIQEKQKLIEKQQRQIENLQQQLLEMKDQNNFDKYRDDLMNQQQQIINQSILELMDSENIDIDQEIMKQLFKNEEIKIKDDNQSIQLQIQQEQIQDLDQKLTNQKNINYDLQNQIQIVIDDGVKLEQQNQQLIFEKDNDKKQYDQQTNNFQIMLQCLFTQLDYIVNQIDNQSLKFKQINIEDDQNIVLSFQKFYEFYNDYQLEQKELIIKTQNNQKNLYKEINELQKQTQELSQTSQQKLHNMATQQNKIKQENIQLVKDIQEISKQKKSLIEELQVLSEDVSNWKNKYNKSQNEIKNNLEEFKIMQGKSTKVDDLQQEILRQKEQINILKKENNDLNEEEQNLQNTIQNLQQMYEDSNEKQINLEIRFQEQISFLKNDLVIQNKFQQQIQDYQQQNQNLNNMVEVLNKQLIQMSDKYKKSEQDKTEIKNDAHNLLKKIKNEQIYKDNLVDKRVLSKFLVNYFDINTNYQVKLQLLETLSSILSFTDDDKKKIGIYKQGLQTKMETQLINKDIDEVEKIEDKLAIFLMQEDEDD